MFIPVNMNRYLTLLIITISFIGCQSILSNPESEQITDWGERSASLKSSGTTYLSVYSQVYGLKRDIVHELTSIITIRNTSRKDRVYVKSAELYKANGSFIRDYLRHPIFIEPMETLELVIFRKEGLNIEEHEEGNFIFEWAARKADSKPHFEAVMISTRGKHGLAFTTTGVEVIN